MRKFLLIAVAAAAMSVAALPSASLAHTARAHVATDQKCAPGNDNPSYCERCPDTQAADQNTANVGGAAALAAAEALTGDSRSITFTFTPTACGTFHFELLFAVVVDHHLKYIGVAVAVHVDKAGVPLTITAPISDFGHDVLSHQASHHDTLQLEVIVTQVNKHGGNKGTAALFGHISF